MNRRDINVTQPCSDLQNVAPNVLFDLCGVCVSHARRLKSRNLHWMQIPQNYLRDMSYLLDNCQIIVLQ